MIRVGIIGVTGYTGLELLRILAHHPHAKVTHVGVRSEVDTPITQIFPSLIGSYDALTCISVNDEAFYDCDVVFFATPYGVAMNRAESFLDRGVKVIDLGADFRMQNHTEWSQWYDMPHEATSTLTKAVYGLVEAHAPAITNAHLVANPGCYPTAIMLGLLPLLEQQLISSKIIADCKSGVSGAGRSPKTNTLLCEASENLTAYGVNHHRHKPEIVEQLHQFDSSLELVFTPHLIPMKRGMLATLYIDVNTTISVQEMYADYYKDNHMIHIMPSGTQPQTKSVIGTPATHIGIVQDTDEHASSLIITSAIDNVAKGASAQAVQNMNLMFGHKVNTGLSSLAVLP